MHMAEHQPENDPETESLTFEQSLASLEGIINQIEGGEIGLEASLAAYQKGEQLIRRCRALLFQAEQRIETIRLDDLPAGEDAGERS